MSARSERKERREKKLEQLRENIEQQINDASPEDDEAFGKEAAKILILRSRDKPQETALFHIVCAKLAQEKSFASGKAFNVHYSHLANLESEEKKKAKRNKMRRSRGADYFFDAQDE